MATVDTNAPIGKHLQQNQSRIDSVPIGQKGQDFVDLNEAARSGAAFNYAPPATEPIDTTDPMPGDFYQPTEIVVDDMTATDWKQKLTLKLLALIFGVVSIGQTLLSAATAGGSFFMATTLGLGGFTVVTLVIQILMLIFVVQIYREKWDNSLALAIVLLFLLGRIPGALLIADAVVNKDSKKTNN